MAFVFLTFCLVHCIYCEATQSWGYEEIDPFSYWVYQYPECGSSRQSPIDIIIDESSKCDEPLLLEWTSQMEHFIIRNNGHSLQAIPFEITYEGGSDLSNLEVLHHTNDTNIRLKNKFYHTFKSQVNAEYCFDSLHFHWGDTNEYGSEHRINGKYYPLEIHLVFYSCDYYLAGDASNAYSTREAAAKYDDDNVLSVIGVLFEIGEENPVLDIILSDVDVVHKYHDPEDVNDNILELYYTEFDMEQLLPSNKEMIGYLGSLTTPPCYEAVRWNVMKTAMTVSQQQLDDFRMMLKSTNLNDTMAPNFRPLQDIGDRVIYQCQEAVDAEIVEKQYNVQIISNDDNDKIWLIIAIILGCLFIVAIGIIAVLLYIVYNKKEGETINDNDNKGRTAKKGYRKTHSDANDADYDENDDDEEKGDIDDENNPIA